MLSLMSYNVPVTALVMFHRTLTVRRIPSSLSSRLLNRRLGRATWTQSHSVHLFSSLWNRSSETPYLLVLYEFLFIPTNSTTLHFLLSITDQTSHLPGPTFQDYDPLSPLFSWVSVSARKDYHGYKIILKPQKEKKNLFSTIFFNLMFTCPKLSYHKLLIKDLFNTPH